MSPLLSSSAPLCACGTLAVWFPMAAAAAAAKQQRGAKAATATAPASLLGAAFAALKSSAGGSSAAGQWLVGKKPATLTMSSSGRGAVLVQASSGEKGKRGRERKKNAAASLFSCLLYTSDAADE